MRPAHRWRRRLAGWWLRWKRWEFWPPWALYPPIVAWILWLTLRHGGLSVFTSVNTKLWSAGVIGGSKIRILAALSSCDERVARSWLLAPDPDLDRRTERLLEATARLGLDWPVVLKPDSGARGRGVGIVHDGAEARAHLAAEPGPLVLQEYVPGREYGVFYTRMPGEARGRIFSITDKRPAEVVGDGRRCLEELIYDDPRAVALARVYCEGLAGRLAEVPAAGERVRLGELGTHCRGAIFLDGNHLRTPALEDAVDRLASAVEGFHFGRLTCVPPPSRPSAGAASRSSNSTAWYPRRLMSTTRRFPCWLPTGCFSASGAWRPGSAPGSGDGATGGPDSGRCCERRWTIGAADRAGADLRAGAAGGTMARHVCGPS
ncbi:MAG: hypothetical protein Q9Q13_08670 [Acidobacteriota bacterium]|nr:hypothetical protein [Acidobacteriota bacterium]